MKKMLMLILVLGVSSIASAALQISVNGNWYPSDSQINLAPSGHVTLDIWTDAQIGPAMSNITFALCAAPAKGTFSGGSYVGPRCWYTDELGDLQYDADGSLINYPPGDIITPGEQGITGWVQTYGSTEGIAANSLLFNYIDFHCESVGDTIIHLYRIHPTAGTIVSTYDSVTIHQIPEPVTVALLSLGGLFLRRRIA